MKSACASVAHPILCGSVHTRCYINQCAARKISLKFFGVMKNGQIFHSKVCHFQYIRDSLLVEKLETLEVARR